MPLSQIPRWNPSSIVLSSNMVDAGADGIGGSADGICRMIAPIRSRIRSLVVAFDGAVAAANGFRVDSAAGTIADDSDQRSMRAPISATSSSSFMCSGFDDRNNLLEAGQMFRVKSDGACGASIRAAVTAVLEPIGPIDFPGPLFCYSGYFNSATSGTLRLVAPLPCGVEVLHAWTGLSATIAAQANTFSIMNNFVASASFSLGAGGNDLTTFGGSARGSAARFFSPSQTIQISMSGGANYTSQLPYTLLCRRLS